MNLCLEKGQLEFPTIRFFKRFNGQLYTSEGRPVKVGVNGQADVYALVPSPIGPVIVELEFKTGNARQSESQVNYQKLIESMHGIYGVIKCYEDLQKLIKICLDKIESIGHS